MPLNNEKRSASWSLRENERFVSLVGNDEDLENWSKDTVAVSIEDPSDTFILSEKQASYWIVVVSGTQVTALYAAL